MILWEKKFWNWNLKDLKQREKQSDVQKERQSDRQGVKQLKYTKIGQVQRETRLGSLITRLIQEQRTEEIPIVSTDAKRREQLYKEYNL